MVALIFGIVSATGWIIFDIVVAVVTYPFMGAATWWAIVVSGALLVAITVVAEILGYRESRQESATSAREHGALANANIAIWDKLEVMTNTKGQSANATIEVATAKIARLEGTLKLIQDRDWTPLGPEEKAVLTSKLRPFSKHRVQVSSHNSTDCIRLATDIRRCFESAEWQVRQWPLTGTAIYMPDGDHGIRIDSNIQSEVLRRVVSDALMEAARGSTSGTIDSRPVGQDQDWAEIRIMVRPKSARYDI